MLKKSQANSTLTRQALCAAVFDCCPQLSRAKARELVDATFEELSEALVRGEPVKLRSFGAFVPRAKRERIGRNPKTGTEAPIRARRVISFHASPVLVARVNGEPPGETGD
jgi:integration host factor subunit alpha